MALVMRGIFIVIGAAVVERFVAIFFLFGAILIWTAYKLITEDPEEDEWQENRIISALRKRGRLGFLVTKILSSEKSVFQ